MQKYFGVVWEIVSNSIFPSVYPRTALQVSACSEWIQGVGHGCVRGGKAECHSPPPPPPSPRTPPPSTLLSSPWNLRTISVLGPRSLFKALVHPLPKWHGHTHAHIAHEINDGMITTIRGTSGIASYTATLRRFNHSTKPAKV